MNLLIKLAARILAKRSHKQRQTIRDTTNAMWAHLKLSGRLG